jgi:hypothetical protein
MAITKNTIYNPEFHGNIPMNFRHLWKAKTDRELTFTDEEIFNVWKVEAHNWSSPADGFDTEDEYILFILEEMLDKKENPLFQ